MNADDARALQGLRLVSDPDAQIPSHIAKLLKYVEVGVKGVPYAVKAATYQALLGVLSQQNPYRRKQDQLDLMNDLAKYGWGMAEPPAISPTLAKKIGFSGLSGLRLEEPRGFESRGDDRRGSGGRGFGGSRGGMDQGRARPPPSRGPGVFGGSSSGGDAFAQMGYTGESRRGGGRR